MTRQSVYISYAREDSAIVARLKAELANSGVATSIDRHALDKELRWKPAIAKAIKECALFLACFSSKDGTTTYQNDELLLAIDVQRMLPDRRWLIPIELSSCEIPALPIDATRTVATLDSIALHGDWDAGLARLIVLAPTSPEDRTTPVTPPASAGPMFLVEGDLTAGRNINAPSTATVRVKGHAVADRDFDATGAPKP